jgi:hypothetical protein
MGKKTYEVGMRYEAYAELLIEADSEEEAEAIAWERVHSVKTHGDGWDIQTIFEVKEQ